MRLVTNGPSIDEWSSIHGKPISTSPDKQHTHISLVFELLNTSRRITSSRALAMRLPIEASKDRESGKKTNLACYRRNRDFVHCTWPRLYFFRFSHTAITQRTRS